VVKGYGETEATVDTIVSRLEDLEDDMQVCKTNVDVTKIQLSSVERDIRMLESSMGNTHKQLENLGDWVDGFVSSLRTYSNREVSNRRALGLVVEEVRKGARADHESLLGKFARTGDIIDKKFVQLDTELDKVVELVGEKIKKEVGEITHDFVEVMEIEEAWRSSSEVKVASLEEKLEVALGQIANLASLVTNLQGQVGELEDAVMEEASDLKGGTAVSTSSSEFDPVENMVAIPIPPPIIHNMLIPIKVPVDFLPEAFIPLSLRETPSPPMSRHVRRIRFMMGSRNTGLTQRLARRRSYSSISL
jgi:chromosome segregation ATPase